MSATIEIDQLREGMFIHLDLGWWQHPFALSSFMVSTREQIETLRGLGLKRVRWSPEMSRLHDATQPASGPAQEAAADGGDGAMAADAVAADPARAQTAALAAQHAELAAQRAADLLCEKQYAEAGHAWKQMAEAVHGAPTKAREISEALTRSLLDKMMVDGDLCIRVLSDSHGDRASAHALNVGVIALLMGRQVGLTDAELHELGVGALLHDIGKLELADRLRWSDPDFSQAEHAAYREHVAHGLVLGQRMGLNRATMQVLAQHHEMADGSGFPLRLHVDGMAVAARIVALINRYDNLCNPLRQAYALTPHEALSLIFAQAKNKFDASLLGSFIRMMGVYPPGSLVQLTDERYATVVSVNSSRPLKPRVLVCDPKVAADDALRLDLDTQPELGIRRSVKATQLPAAALSYLSPGPRVVYFFEPAAPTRRDPMEALAA